MPHDVLRGLNYPKNSMLSIKRRDLFIVWERPNNDFRAFERAMAPSGQLVPLGSAIGTVTTSLIISDLTELFICFARVEQTLESCRHSVV